MLGSITMLLYSLFIWLSLLPCKYISLNQHGQNLELVDKDTTGIDMESILDMGNSHVL